MTAGGVEPVEPVGTYARRAGDSVRLQLLLPDAEGLTEPTLQLRRRNGKARIVVPATASTSEQGVLVTAGLPREELRPGLWHIALKPDQEGPFRPLQARLLFNAKQPIALLAGPAPRTEMPEPSPRRAASNVPAKSPSRARHVAVTIVDKALSRLPEERAARYRASLGRLARRFSS